VNWFDAMAYCHWLSAEWGDMRLPTEAEWECARERVQGSSIRGRCAAGVRGGRCSTVGAGGGLGAKGSDFRHVREVHEWCSDLDAGYYAMSGENRRGRAGGSPGRRAGGAWRIMFKFSRCAARSSIPPSFGMRIMGFGGG